MVLLRDQKHFFSNSTVLVFVFLRDLRKKSLFLINCSTPSTKKGLESLSTKLESSCKYDNKSNQ